MASEITASVFLRFQKAGREFTLSRTGNRFDVSGDDANIITQLVGTTEEALLLGDVVPGFILIINEDNTNYVSVRRASGEGNFHKIRAGSFSLYELEASAPYVIANTAACRIRFLAIDA